MIPKNILREHIEKAVEEINPTFIPANRLPDKYLLVHHKKTLPPKYVISIANKYANGKELDSEQFNAVEAKDYLLKMNFQIETKNMDYYSQLKKFLSQSETDELGTANYLNNYQGLSVKVSFGKGNQAKVPWIAFLNDIDNVQQGIYPVYLYYKEKKLLILAYGVSETHPSSRKWNIKDEKTIEQFFVDNNFGKPDRYGKSFVFKSYDINKRIQEQEINNDLSTLIKIYKQTADLPKDDPIIKFNYKTFHQKTKEAGLMFTEKIVSRFVASLCTKPFVICSGLSGSGKTKLAQSFVQWICANEEQYKIVPVGADWTNREPLLGFPNGLDKETYVFPDSGALQLILRAINPINENKPHFLILDEMNLSHVERYFADFLSIMESKDKIKLYSGEKRGELPKEISWPKNLFVIGTVNIDETTYMFSPKVLDRANVIEFRISETEIEKYLATPGDLDMEQLYDTTTKQGYGSSMAADFLNTAREKASSDILTKDTFVDFFKELKKSGAEFGYRSASEINRLIAILDSLTKKDRRWDESEISDNDFIDIAIMQKLLPKIHGSRSKLNTPLTTLAKFCIEGGINNFEAKDDNFRKIYFSSYDKIEVDNKAKIIYPLSFEKIARMHKNAIDNGFTSYAEA